MYQKGGGRGGGLACRRRVLFSSAAGGAYWPIAIRCPSLGPFPSIGGGTHRPLTALCPPSPSLAFLSLSTSLSFPSGGCANASPGLSLFHCSTSGPHGGGQLSSPLARGRGGGGGQCSVCCAHVVGRHGKSKGPGTMPVPVVWTQAHALGLQWANVAGPHTRGAPKAQTFCQGATSGWP